MRQLPSSLHRLPDRVWPAAVAMAVALACGVAGCEKPRAGTPAAPAPATAPAPGFAPALLAAGAADPDLKAARAAASDTLDGLLSGRYDNDRDLAPVARKVRGYTSWSVASQEKQSHGAGAPASWDFTGTLAAPGSAAGFTASLFKQGDGTWAVGSFDGPHPR